MVHHGTVFVTSQNNRQNKFKEDKETKRTGWKKKKEFFEKNFYFGVEGILTLIERIFGLQKIFHWLS